MLGKTGFPVSIFEIPKVLVESDFERSAKLSDIFFCCIWGIYLIDPAVVVFAFSAVVFRCQKFTCGIVRRERDFNIGILECIRNGSSLFINVCEFYPLYFLIVFLLFNFTM